MISTFILVVWIEWSFFEPFTLENFLKDIISSKYKDKYKDLKKRNTAINIEKDNRLHSKSVYAPSKKRIDKHNEDFLE